MVKKVEKKPKKKVTKKKPVVKKKPGKELAKPVEQKIQVNPNQVTEKIIDDYIFGNSTKLTNEHKLLFKKTAVNFQLNPFKREIYAIPYTDYKGEVQMSIITGYEVYLKRAERSGKLSGWKVWTKKEGNETIACIEIYRKDFKEPIYHEVLFSEYNQNNKIWKSKPVTMIKKVAMAQGFRLAFPDDLGGIPYTADELPDNMTTINVTPQEQSQPVQEPEKTWGAEEYKTFEHIQNGSKIIGLTALEIKERFNIDKFKDLSLEELKKIDKFVEQKVAEELDKKEQKEKDETENQENQQ